MGSLLPNLIQLAGRFEQFQLGLLAAEVGVEEREPLVALIEARLLDIAQVDFAFLELGLQNAEVLLGELQLEAGNFLGGVGLADVARLLPNRGGNFGAPVSQGGFSGVEIDLREADIRLDASAEDGDVHVDPDIEIVALEMIEE